ncbi:MAG: SDR family NAD(P)-dependent oxidoreductase [Muribaculum sp.]|nr:SDR family NAD(P)-dependent oxidoreductase [Muribaculaceae bacterium]MCM1080321.1 SDR family NAD(P)-dependent oxidoreductase [Muribaculum sp.]
MARKFDIAGMNALVTGASSGIGLEFCRQLAARHCNLIMVSNQSDLLQEHAAAIAASYKVKVRARYADLAAPDSANMLLQWLDAEAVLPDIVINNAGIFTFRTVADTPREKIDTYIGLHIRAVTELSQAFAQRMRNRGSGWILNMSSMSCWMPMPGIAMYAATKAYIRVFTRALHYEMRDYGVHIMVACPGGIATDLFGLPPKLMRIAVGLRVLQTPRKFVEKAINGMLKGRKQYINGWLNRLAILFVGVSPTWLRMAVKHRMLDKNITR